MSLAVGVAIALLDRWAGRKVSRHLLGAAALAAALLGAWPNPRTWPWLIAAAVLTVWPDDATRSDPVVSHPLGSWTVAATVVSLVGVWSAVPDTEPALAAGCVLAALGLERLLGRRPVGRPGTAALVVAVVGATWVGSAGWGSAVATVCAVGMVLCAPVAVGFGRAELSDGGRRPWVLPTLLAAHAVVALAVPRFVMRRDTAVAAAIAVAVMVALNVLARLVAGPDTGPDSGELPDPDSGPVP